MIANAPNAGSREDRVMARLTDEHPKTKMKVSDEERKEILERITKEGDPQSEELQEAIAQLFDKDADILEDLADREARAEMMKERLQNPSPAMDAIVKDVAIRQRQVLTDFEDSTSTMKNETMAYGEGQARAKNKAEEAIVRTQTDAEYDEIRRKLLNGPDKQNAA